MSIFEVVEYIPAVQQYKNAQGFFTTVIKAREAVHRRILEMLIVQDDKALHCKWSNDGMICNVPETDRTNSITYVIYEHALNEGIS